MSSLLGAVLDFYDVQYRDTATGEQQILCPVHDERVKSCSLNLSEDVWYCHACGQFGGPLQIIIVREHMDNATATARLEKIAGEGNFDLSGGDRPRRKVPRGQGFVPGYRRAIQTRRGKRPDFGS